MNIHHGTDLFDELIKWQSLSLSEKLTKKGNAWTWDEGTRTLSIRPNPDHHFTYWIDESRLADPAEITDWLAHLLEKTWVTPKVLYDFVQALDLLGVLR